MREKIGWILKYYHNELEDSYRGKCICNHGGVFHPTENCPKHDTRKIESKYTNQILALLGGEKEYCECKEPVRNRGVGCLACLKPIKPLPQPKDRIEPLNYDKLDITRTDQDTREFPLAIQVAINELRQKTEELIQAHNEGR